VGNWPGIIGDNWIAKSRVTLDRLKIEFMKCDFHSPHVVYIFTVWNITKYSVCGFQK